MRRTSQRRARWWHRSMTPIKPGPFQISFHEAELERRVDCRLFFRVKRNRDSKRRNPGTSHGQLCSIRDKSGVVDLEASFLGLSFPSSSCKTSQCSARRAKTSASTADSRPSDGQRKESAL